MKNHRKSVGWATQYLISVDNALLKAPEMVVETPWSTVIRFSTSQGYFYLKQTPASIAIESKIILFLANNVHLKVPEIIAVNDALHCFIMKDSGEALRQYLKRDMQPDLLCRALTQYTSLQRALEADVNSLLALGLPDWRLTNIPHLFSQLIQQKDFLQADGMTGEELEQLEKISPKLTDQCKFLAQYQIPETFVQSDFHSNNILFDSNKQKLTLIDLGETVITHPFFSLHTFIHQAIIHHKIKVGDPTYHELQNACFKNWRELLSKSHLLAAFNVAKELWPIYNALGAYRLMSSVNLSAFNAYYADRPRRLSGYFREYVANIRINYGIE